MKSNEDLTQGSIPRKIIYFAIPLFLGNLFQQLYNMADSLIVGQFLGSKALAAVTSTGNLIFLLVGFFNGTAMGAGVVIARYFGAKDYRNVRKAIHTDLAFGVVCGIIMTVVGVVFAPQILKLMQTPPEVFADTAWYLRVYFLGSIAIVLYNVCMGILQAVGDSRHPLYYLIFSSVINILLDLIFNGLLHLGVAYAALATVISQIISVLFCLRRLTRRVILAEGSEEEQMVLDAITVRLSDIRIERPMLRQIVWIGLPSGLQNSIISIANVVIQSKINAFGSDAMAGCGSYWKIEGFGFLPITCFAMAMTTFIGQNLGAGKYDRAKKGAAFGLICSMTAAELIGIVIYLFIPQLLLMFSHEPEVISYGTTHARTVTLFYFLLALSHTVAGIMRGAGKATVPMYVMLAVWCVFRITYVTVIHHFVPGIRIVLTAYPITWAISGVIFVIYMWKADWLHSFEKGS